MCVCVCVSHFDAHGNYYSDDDTEAVQDNWLTDVDWNKVSGKMELVPYMLKQTPPSNKRLCQITAGGIQGMWNRNKRLCQITAGGIQGMWNRNKRLFSNKRLHNHTHHTHEPNATKSEAFGQRSRQKTWLDRLLKFTSATMPL